jgi:glyoxylase-like metal-dependent hydrolase (beta-lactamase superfamily II)
MTTEQESAVLAVRYGTMETTRAHQFHRYAVYHEPDAQLKMDYFFWVIRNGEETILVDSGYHPRAIEHRPGRQCLIPPVEALQSLGVDCDQVSTVVVTHFHFDHIGNLSAFPNARYVVQRRELSFWTGPHARRAAVAASVEPTEIQFLADAQAAGRVDLVDGDHQVAEGIRVILVGGHCPGQQVVFLDGARPLVLCSDALHFSEEMERYMPFSVLFDLQAMYEAYDTFNRWAAEGATVVAGHDPRVMSDFAPEAGADGLAVRLR